MKLDFVFFLNSIMLGIGLAMDAFSVSMANGLNEPKMKKGKMFGVAGIFGAFQGVMPLIGWICVHSFVTRFEAFSKYIPWIALVLLCFIGGKMLYDSFKGTEENEKAEVGLAALLVQAVATSIDALSVGFTMVELLSPGNISRALSFSGSLKQMWTYGSVVSSGLPFALFCITFETCISGHLQKILPS